MTRNRSEQVLLFVLILATYRSVFADTHHQSKCLKAKDEACLWVGHTGVTAGASEAHVGRPCPSGPDCGCLYHGQCYDHGKENPIYIFVCKNKTSGEPCSEVDGGWNHRFKVPGGKKLEKGGLMKSRKRRDTSDPMKNIPPVLRKIINRHRLQNPQSFGAGTFFLSGFSHINESMLLMNVVDAQKMQEEYNPPRGHDLDSDGKDIQGERSSTDLPQSSTTKGSTSAQEE